MPLTLIGITGDVGTGKTTISEYLENIYGFTKYDFERPAQECTHLEKSDINNKNFDKFNYDSIKLFDMYMVKNNELYPNGCIIVPDVKFINEADAIKKLGGYIIKIDRCFESTTNLNNILSTKNINKTNSCVINVDFTISNLTTKDALYENISTIVDNLIHII